MAFVIPTALVETVKASKVVCRCANAVDANATHVTVRKTIQNSLMSHSYGDVMVPLLATITHPSEPAAVTVIEEYAPTVRDCPTPPIGLLPGLTSWAVTPDPHVASVKNNAACESNPDTSGDGSVISTVVPLVTRINRSFRSTVPELVVERYMPPLATALGNGKKLIRSPTSHPSRSRMFQPPT